jgi:MFS transporter, ACDE family, multidrug resistance protein
VTPSTEDPRRLLPLILAISGAGVLTFSLISPTLPDLAAELGVSRGVIGMVQGAVAIPGIFLAVFVGYIADLKGRRFVAIGSLLAYGLGGTIGFFARSFWPLVVTRAFQGLGTSGILSLGVVVIGDLWPPGLERRKALGINSAGLTLTGMVAPIVGGALAAGGVFRPYLVFLLAFPLAVWARKLPGPPSGPPPPRPLTHVRSMFASLRRNGRLADFVGLLPFSFVVMVVFIGFAFTTSPLYLEEVFDVDSTGRGLMVALASVGSSSGSLASARLAASFTTPQLLTGSFVCVAAGFAALAVAPSLVVVGPALVLLGFGIGVVFPAIQNFVASAVPDQERGAAVGTWISSIRVGQAIGPILATSILAAVGDRTAYGVVAAVVLVLAVAWRPLRSYARTQSGEGIYLDPRLRP